MCQTISFIHILSYLCLYNWILNQELIATYLFIINCHPPAKKIWRPKILVHKILELYFVLLQIYLWCKKIPIGSIYLIKRVHLSVSSKNERAFFTPSRCPGHCVWVGPNATSQLSGKPHHMVRPSQESISHRTACGVGLHVEVFGQYMKNDSN